MAEPAASNATVHIPVSIVKEQVKQLQSQTGQQKPTGAGKKASKSKQQKLPRKSKTIGSVQTTDQNYGHQSISQAAISKNQGQDAPMITQYSQIKLNQSAIH